MAATARTRFLKDYPAALHDGTGAVFVGAGVSMAAGYPSWATLLKDIGDELGVKSTDIHDLAALAQWHIHSRGNNKSGVLNVIKQEIGKERAIPKAVETLARLPLHHIWTTNYDRLIERAFSAINRPLDAVSGARDLSLRPRSGAVRLYKMHGSIDRLEDIVISTDDYELYRTNRGAFLPLLQAHLSGMSLLFIGLSLTDPNIRHVLSSIRECFTNTPPEHFALLRPPKRKDFKTKVEFDAKCAQHGLWAKDLQRYGLVAVEIENYDEVPVLLEEVERRVASMRVWVSGSWPLEADEQTIRLYNLAERIGRLVGTSGRDLVSGSGVLVGSAAVTGFFDALRDNGAWDLERRLIVKSFPQPLPDKLADREMWTAFRREMARQAGIVIFLGGMKLVDGQQKRAGGVMEEFRLAKAAGAFLLPVGGTGGAAKWISSRLRGSALTSRGTDARRPTDEELNALDDPTNTPEKLLAIIDAILKRLTKVS